MTSSPTEFCHPQAFLPTQLLAASQGAGHQTDALIELHTDTVGCWRLPTVGNYTVGKSY